MDVTVCPEFMGYLDWLPLAFTVAIVLNWAILVSTFYIVKKRMARG